MAKVKISEFDVNPDNNTDINNINIAEGCAPSGINNAIRQLMSDLKAFQTGADGDPFNGAVNGTVGATTPATGAFTTLSASSTATLNTLSSSGATITGGSINGTTVGASTASTGAFTTLSASGAFSANGGTTLGDASGDALTINSSAVSIPNGLNFDSNTFVIDATNNRVGVGTASPAYRLDIPLTGTVAANLGGVLVGANGTDVVSNTGLLSLQTTGATNMTFFTNSSERMRITSAGNLAIGISSSNFKTTIQGSENTGDPANPAQLAIESSTAYNSNPVGGIIFRTKYNTAGDYAGMGGIIVGKANTTDGNYASYLALTTRANGSNVTERLRIDSAGNVGIGTSSPAAKLQVGTSSFSRDTNFDYASALSALEGGNVTNAFLKIAGGLYNQASTTNIDLITSAKDNNFDQGFRITSGVGAGSATNNGYLSFSRMTYTGSAIGTTERMRIDSSGNLLVGKTSATANGGDIQVSSGITFPATQVAKSDANTLDDYEEGTFTPTVSGVTLSSATGTYTKIGRQVFVSFDITWPTNTNTTAITIASLPFTPVANSGTMSVGYTTYANILSGVCGGAGIAVYGFNGNPASSPQNIHLSGLRLIASATYTV